LNFFPQLKIGQRLSLAFGLVLGLQATLVVVSLLQARTLNGNVIAYQGQVVPGIETINQLSMGIEHARRHELRLMLATQTADIEDQLHELAQDRADVATSLEAYSHMLDTARERAELEPLQRLVGHYWEVQDQVLALTRHKLEDPAAGAAAIKLNLGDSSKAYFALAGLAASAAKHEEERGDALAISANQTYERVIETVVGFAAGALCLSIFVQLASSRSITLPLSRGIKLVQAVARGDLTQRVGVDSRDEVGQLLTGLNEMTAHLAALVSDVAKSAESVNLATREIAQGNDDLSQRTQAQAASLEETAASMEEITVIGQNNAQHAGQASSLAHSTRDLAESGGSVVAQAISAMAEINDSSSRIGTIIGVIDAIAFQTNLLALNAAVEAARAGEQGRGFAVVAAEVRALAQRSADAAKEIKALIAESVDKVQAGSELVDRSGERLSKIVDSVKQIAELIGQIAESSREQAQGVTRINEVIVQLDGNTQQNAALVEQCSAASHALSQQAEALTRRAAQFQVGTAGHTLAPAASAVSAQGGPSAAAMRLAA
jgi:methyl-accepting chemotaxis protein